jgi:hypothetical protein
MSTSTPLFSLPPDLFDKAQETGQAWALELLRAILKSTWSTLSPFWPYALGGFFLILIVVMAKWMMGQTGPLGSLLYHAFYFSILALILWIGGLEILFNPIFDILYALLYPLSYYLTGRILRRVRYG